MGRSFYGNLTGDDNDSVASTQTSPGHADPSNRYWRPATVIDPRTRLGRANLNIEAALQSGQGAAAYSFNSSPSGCKLTLLSRRNPSLFSSLADRWLSCETMATIRERPSALLPYDITAEADSRAYPLVQNRGRKANPRSTSTSASRLMRPQIPMGAPFSFNSTA